MTSGVDEVQALLAIEAIKGLKARYFRLMDTKEWGAYRDLFTDDMVFFFESDTPQTRSGDEFVAFVRARLADATTAHHGHMPEIELTSATTATGVWAMYDWVDDPAQDRAFQGYGHYHERYRRDEDGRWRIAELRLSRLRVDERPPTEGRADTTPAPRPTPSAVTVTATSSVDGGREPVRYARHGRVAVLTIDRPDRKNAWDFDIERHLFDLADEADADPEVHVVVLTGSGTSFCPGMDIAKLSALGSGPGVPQRDRPPTHLRTLRKPTIAAINGGVAGIGLVQALCCDIRIAAAEARISCAFPRRGAPAEYGAAWLLQRQIGAADATELLLSGRTIDAAEAERLRLVTGVRPRVELMDHVLEYAEEIAERCAPLALEAAKIQLEHAATSTLDEAVALSRTLAHEPGRRPDLAEGARAYLERRLPHFSPLPPRDRTSG